MHDYGNKVRPRGQRVGQKYTPFSPEVRTPLGNILKQVIPLAILPDSVAEIVFKKHYYIIIIFSRTAI